MEIKYNRFAILPHTCSECERTFWLEPYKHYKIEEIKIMGCVEYVTNICKNCNEVLEQTKNKQTGQNVLDKIRVEIEQNAYPIVHGVNNHELGMTLYGILQVINKYTAESEDKEWQ